MIFVVLFVSPDVVESFLDAVEIVDVVDVLIRGGIAVSFERSYEVLSVERLTAFEGTGAPGANGPHGEGFVKPWAFLAGRTDEVIDCEGDVNLPWRGI